MSDEALNEEVDFEESEELEPDVEETEDSEEETDSENQDAEEEDSDDPESGKAAGKVTFSPEQQKVLDREISKRVAKMRQAQTQAEALQKRLDALEKNQRQEERPKVPELPNPLDVSDADYQKAQQQREDAIGKRAEFDAEQRRLEQERTQLNEQKQQQELEALNQRVGSYRERATKLGVKAEELKEAGDAVAQFNIASDLVDLILDDDAGPLMTKYLGQNLAELERISEMSPTRAAAYLASTVKSKALKLKPKTTQAPNPPKKPPASSSSTKAGSSVDFTYY